MFFTFDVAKSNDAVRTLNYQHSEFKVSAFRLNLSSFESEESSSREIEFLVKKVHKKISVDENWLLISQFSWVRQNSVFARSPLTRTLERQGLNLRDSDALVDLIHKKEKLLATRSSLYKFTLENTDKITASFVPDYFCAILLLQIKIPMTALSGDLLDYEVGHLGNDILYIIENGGLVITNIPSPGSIYPGICCLGRNEVMEPIFR